MTTSSEKPSEKVSHTPTPWKFSRTHGLSSDTWYVVTDAEGYGPVVEVGGKDFDGQIAEAKHLITDPAVIKANAAFIVRACNSHEELVEALRDLLGFVNTLTIPLETHGEIHRAEAALSAAGVKP